MHPVDVFIEIKWVPAELIGYMMQLLIRRQPPAVSIIAVERLEIRMCGRGKNAIKPCLLVLVARSCECSARQLFCI
jgi:hypothetical protein